MANGEENPQYLNEFFYTWRIENFNLLRQNWRQKITTGEKLKSPTFEVGWMQKISYSLVLYPDGIKDNEDCISYFLAREDEVAQSFKLFKTELYLLALDGSKVEAECPSGFLSMIKSGMVGHPRFMSWETLMNEKSYYFPDDILTVGCRLSRELKQDTKGNKATLVKVCSDQIYVRTRIKKEVIAKQMVIDSIAPQGQKIGEMKSLLQDCPIATFFGYFNKILDEKTLIIDIDIKKDDRIKAALFKFMLIDDKRRIFWMDTYSWNDVTAFHNITLSPYSPPNSKFYVPNEMFVEKFLFLACQFTFTTGLVEQRKEKEDYGANLNHLLPVYFPSCPHVYEKPLPCLTLKDSLMNMYQDKLFHDVTLKNGSSELTAHKFVLCSRSGKFETLLSAQDGESPVNERAVEEDIKTMEKVVYFLYTDDIVEINWKIATTLYSAAIKYEIGLLKHKCCNFIETHLDKSNIVEILLLAKKHKDAELKALAGKFVMENSNEVYFSDEWQDFCKNNPQLAVEIMLHKFQSK